MTVNPLHHILTVTVENKPGVLSRVAGLFSRRAFNIFSLAVSPTDDERFSRMTIVVDAESAPLEQVVKQLNKLIHVIKVQELADAESVDRELALIKVRAEGDARARAIEIAGIFRARVLDVTHQALTIEATGTPDKLEALLELLAAFGVVEMARTGRVALSRGERGIRERTLRKVEGA